MALHGPDLRLVETESLGPQVDWQRGRRVFRNAARRVSAEWLDPAGVREMTLGLVALALTVIATHDTLKAGCGR